MADRKSAEEHIIKYVHKIAPGGENKKLYEDLFKSMSNKDFDLFMNRLRNKEITLSVIVPNGSKIKLSVDRNYKIAKELGFDFFQHLTIGPANGIPAYKTDIKYLVLDLPFRRASQLLTKGVSVSDNNSTVDLTTGQVTGASKGSRITFPELQILTGIGLEKTVLELVKHRGGDTGSLRAMSASLSRYGKVTQNMLEAYSTGVVSTKVLHTYLTAIHLKNNM